MRPALLCEKSNGIASISSRNERQSSNARTLLSHSSSKLPAAPCRLGDSWQGGRSNCKSESFIHHLIKLTCHPRHPQPPSSAPRPASPHRADLHQLTTALALFTLWVNMQGATRGLLVLEAAVIELEGINAGRYSFLTEMLITSLLSLCRARTVSTWRDTPFST